PTWSLCGRQPALVTAREQPTAAPRRFARSSMIAKPSLEPTPRPPLTITFAAARDTPPLLGWTWPETRTTRSSSLGGGTLTSGGEHCGCGEPFDRPRERGRQRAGGEGLHRLHRQRARLAELAREGERLERRIAGLHEHQHVHNKPAFSSKSTTAGAAAGPVPSDSARRPWPAGTASLTSSRCGGGRNGVLTATGLLRARMRPGTEG